MGLFIRTIGIARARTKISLANLAYNISECCGSPRKPRPLDQTTRSRNRRLPEIARQTRTARPKPATYPVQKTGSWRCPAVQAPVYLFFGYTEDDVAIILVVASPDGFFAVPFMAATAGTA